MSYAEDFSMHHYIGFCKSGHIYTQNFNSFLALLLTPQAILFWLTICMDFHNVLIFGYFMDDIYITKFYILHL